MREKELRLALICYGGISLAVYMHGITKEIWHLARASRAFHDEETAPSPTSLIYAGLFESIAVTSGLKLRVLADIIAGASAGGINGIFLAQAIATGQSLDPLTDLWLESADVDSLLDPQAKASHRFSKFWATPLVWAFSGRQGATWDDDLDEQTRDEINAKLTRFVRARWFEPPFGGETFTRLLLDAFDAMGKQAVGPRLLPDEQPLDLFVTVTDFHGHPETLKLNSPAQIIENEHRLTFAFRDAPGEPDLLDAVENLTFAARATASFPGAFPPFTAAELDRVLGSSNREWSDRDAFLTRVLPRRAASELIDKAVLIDGSVLANAPFRPAIEALKQRPARREVDRRFVYIDPKPGIRSVKINRGGEAEIPGFFTTIFGALSDIPREQPIRDNLEALEQRSARIKRMRLIVEKLRPDVEASVAGLFGRTLFIDRPNPARLAGWRQRAEERAARDAGHSYVSYCQLKMANIVDAAPPKARAILVEDSETLTPLEFFAKHDIAYRIRRLRFLGRTLAELEEAYPDAHFEKVSAALYERLAYYLDLEAAPDLSADLLALDGATDAAIAEALAACPKADRRAPLLAYLGFPFYDVATLALLQGEGFDEFDEIKVDRISPDEAQSIRTGDASATLKGIQFNSFGAFFSRTYRENDYLWGRLHGAERLVDIVVSTLPASARLDPSMIASTKQDLFHAILDEEAVRLTHIAPLIAALRTELAGGKKGKTSLDRDETQ
ncbi:patatin-like protein [Sphingomonas paeninsulae]|uniref:Patatin-like protein n=1 Tax=Sphingomonas paeninsulae TaxID=2319844 RepID=A0A494TP54_SPHPE|nr:patatin-like protein [Sphingomonas paeninsulae]AYJ87596.1 patatin-like protein [Sphingomonas paeninsulae]